MVIVAELFCRTVGIRGAGRRARTGRSAGVHAESRNAGDGEQGEGGSGREAHVFPVA
jgi:hypothetical protein